MASEEPVDNESHAERVTRERAFHDDRFADEHRQAAAKYYRVDTGRARYEQWLAHAAAPGSTVLEYGCGTGSKAFDLARAGVTVVGIDISGVGVAEAMAQARREGVDASFLQMDAEQLASAPDVFDVVCGSGILHHLDLDRSMAQIRHVLKPGGVAVFMEPLGTNPIINLYRRMTPSMRTPDEHPLVEEDFQLMRRVFLDVEVERHTLLSLAGAVLVKAPRIGAVLVRALQVLDRALLDRSSLAQRLAWVVVVRLRA